ncbi:uncharacterized protein AMSG_04574 [Thecamonas trahens ATCC 50062]|uniref:Uncharacterized protein n=1 Tax=Thecamonas trahens ATCC 50062 TaxID=461836 RepID=A0A0L0D907_THETB|nr:hypothetical protein AMSG_04574 [Thecamonas trahens ATCC 50062]KNC48829.1 hypothetical protein AMSG_04574 [Thecamonas trahens ATCC 50062]|eukprot:XP_013758249.1 hypothetical protein AMSG_04574 [Thecamonas trahens ATCC 50062]
MAAFGDALNNLGDMKDKVDGAVTKVLEKGVASQVRKLPGGSLIAGSVSKQAVAGAKKDPKKAAKLGRMLARG